MYAHKHLQTNTCTPAYAREQLQTSSCTRRVANQDIHTNVSNKPLHTKIYPQTAARNYLRKASIMQPPTLNRNSNRSTGTGVSMRPSSAHVAAPVYIGDVQTGLVMVYLTLPSAWGLVMARGKASRTREAMVPALTGSCTETTKIKL